MEEGCTASCSTGNTVALRSYTDMGFSKNNLSAERKSFLLDQGAGFRYRNVERLSSLDAAIARSGQS